MRTTQPAAARERDIKLTLPQGIVTAQSYQIRSGLS
jgi:hypothetical protein